MDEFRKILNEQGAEFNIEEPDEGHLERFEQKLIKYHNQRTAWNYKKILKLVAFIILVFFSALWVVEKIIDPSPVQRNLQSMSDISLELGETEYYFTSQINSRYSSIEEYFGSDSPELADIRDELAEMDSVYKKELLELQMNPGDERIINAIINNYQVKIEILTRILNILQNVKQTNYDSNEKFEI